MPASARDSYRIEYLCSLESLRIAPSEKSRSDHCAPVAQMDRALASGAKGRGFESLLARHFLNPLAFLRVQIRRLFQFGSEWSPRLFTHAFALVVDPIDRSEEQGLKDAMPVGRADAYQNSREQRTKKLIDQISGIFCVSFSS